MAQRSSEPKMMLQQEQRRSIHWKAPFILVSSLLGGIAFAVGHHAFYSTLDQSRTDETKFSQQMNTRIGTAFSFLVRACLVVSIGTAYWQLFWGSVRRKMIPISAIDSMAGMLGAVQDLCSLEAIRANPLLVIIASISWLIPFTMVFPPAALSVRLSPFVYENSQMLSVPGFADPARLDAFAYSTNSAEQTDKGSYVGPSRSLVRTSMGTAFQGSLPDIPVTVLNSSYTLDFQGPAVSCAEMKEETQEAFSKAWAKYAPEYECIGLGENKLCHTDYYVSWAPNLRMMLPEEQGNTTILRNVTSALPQLGTNNENPITIFVATRPESEDWMLLNCTLFNASYTVDFNFSQAQPLRLAKPPVLLNAVWDDTSFNGYDDDVALAWMYQAVMQTLGKVIVGSIFRRWWTTGQIIPLNGAMLQLNLLYTKLVATNELSAIPMNLTLPKLPSSGQGLSAEIEALAMNFTLALFSDPDSLQQQDKLTNMTTTELHNIYTYNWSSLVLAYGIACAVTLIAAIVGCITIYQNGVSYSNKFSTIVRTTRDSELDALIQVEDRVGKDPLPEEIASARLRVGEKAWLVAARMSRRNGEAKDENN